LLLSSFSFAGAKVRFLDTLHSHQWLFEALPFFLFYFF
jgi:hypothetical protein